jgi:hypothetical protein
MSPISQVIRTVHCARSQNQEIQKDETTTVFNATVVYIQDSQSPAEKKVGIKFDDKYFESKYSQSRQDSSRSKCTSLC